MAPKALNTSFRCSVKAERVLTEDTEEEVDRITFQDSGDEPAHPASREAMAFTALISAATGNDREQSERHRTDAAHDPGGQREDVCK